MKFYVLKKFIRNMKRFLSQLSTQINSQINEWQANVEQDSSIVGMADFRISDLKLSGKVAVIFPMGRYSNAC